MIKWIVLLTSASAALGQSMIADITTEVETPFGVYKPRLVTVVPDAPPFDPGKDLEHVVNLRNFTFSAEQLNLFKRNGFVVTPALRNSKPVAFNEMFDLYTECRENGIPQFITTDALLHGFHLMFDRILKTCEEERFIAQLNALLKALFETTRGQYDAATDKAVREALFRNLDYLLVALKLLNPPDVLPVEPLPGGRYHQELELILEASAFLVDSPIFQYPEDYTQYKPRGHYTRSEELQRYFRCMMWLGRMTFSCERDSEYDRSMTLSALLLVQALTRTVIDGRPAIDLWEDIYQPTVFFVGKSDDIHYGPYRDLGYSIYGKSFPVYMPDTFSDEAKLAALLQELANIAPAKIGYPGQPTKGFRFMGQRFVPDSWILDELVFNKTPNRWMPTGLDVMIVLGPQSAAHEERAFRYLPEHDRANPFYVAKLDTLKRIFRSYPAETWAQNAYWNWLYCLMPLQMPKGPGYPFFMQSDAWQDKDLHAALASWAELRHDTILYVKQSGTERGLPPTAGQRQGYVEPNPHLFARLASLADFMIEGLNSRGLLFDDFRRHLSAFAELSARLAEIAEKELSRRRLSSEDYQLIFDFGKTLYDVVTFQPEMPSEGPQPFDGGVPEPMPVIADVHTDANSGLALEVGVGYPYAVYVICNIEGRPTIAKGAGFSYYEFTRPATDRLTDEQWREMLAAGEAPPPPSWIAGFFSGEEKPSAAASMPWDKPRSTTLRIDLPERVESGATFTCTFSIMNDWDETPATVTLLSPSGAAIPLVVEKEASTWRATVSTLDLPPGTAYVHIEKGAGEQRLFYRASFEITRATQTGHETSGGSFDLAQNFPNPFNSATLITLTLPQTTRVLVQVFDLNGRRAATLIDAELPAGVHHVSWDGRSDDGKPLGSGIYLYRMKAADFTKIHRMILLR